MNTDREPSRRYRSRITVTPERMEAFAELSGDTNPIHMDRDSALGFGHPEQMAYAGLLLAEVNRIIGVHLPGPGAVCVSYQFDFTAPVYVGESVLFETRVDTAVGSGRRGDPRFQGAARTRPRHRDAGIGDGQASPGRAPADSPEPGRVT